MDSIQPATNAVAAAAPSMTSSSKGTAGTASSVVAPSSVDKTDAKQTPPKSTAEASVQRDPRSLQYQVDGDRVVTTIIDENNKTVVVQIPDAEVIRIAKAIDRMQGFLLQQKA